ncbi:MAG: helix-turn-helix transcriptional regulator, partial [Ktedonobacteraceae bacterium]|nr:helix-turn-helix transcriptional regulator [Ktedonobacteraceae bacterium]
MSFGDRLREERQRRLLTQEELAEALGVSRRSIARWEQNLAIPRTFALQELSRFFGLSPETFFEGLKAQTSDASPGSHHDTERSEQSFEEELEAQTSTPLPH